MLNIGDETQELFRGILFDRIYYMLENYDSTLFEDCTCAFAIPKISTSKDPGQRLVLRLDNELWTNIINQSGLFDAQGPSIPLEWVGFLDS